MSEKDMLDTKKISGQKPQAATESTTFHASTGQDPGF